MLIKWIDRILQKNLPRRELGIVPDWKKCHQSYIYDRRTGREYLDFMTHFASLPLGYNHPKLMTRSFEKHLILATRHKIANPDFFAEEFAEFLKVFIEIAGLPNFHHFFFIDGGALAVENALKTAFDWKTHKNLIKGKNIEASKIIHFHQAFHGRSGYTLSMTESPDLNKTKFFPKFDWPRIINPKRQFPDSAQEEERIKKEEARAVAEIKTFLSQCPDQSAGIIIEPIQGEGGDNHFRKEFFAALRNLCDENEMLLIFDEVQTGVGISGKMWCCQHFDVMPDIVAFGKKTQICGIQASPKLDEVENVFSVPSRISSTFGGSLEDMVRSQRYLEIIHEEHLVAHAAKTGKLFLEKLEDIQKRFPMMSQVRGRGLMIAFDLPSGEDCERLIKKNEEAGLLLLRCGKNSIRFRPPLNVRASEIDEACAILETTLNTAS